MKNPSLLSHFLLALVSVIATPQLRAQATDNPTGPTGMFNGNSATGCSVDLYTGNATRTVNDLAATGAVGRYPLHWSRVLNTRTTAFFGTGFGRGGHWRHSYSWGLSIDASQTKTVVYPDGRIIDLSKPTGDPNLTVAVQPGIGDRLQRFFNSATLEFNYNLLMADGGKVSFRPQDIDDGSGTIIVGYVAYAITDPQQLVTTLTYNGSGLLQQVTEPAGRWLKVFWNTIPGFGNWKQIVSVQAGYGAGTVTQSVSYTYSAYGPFPTLTNTTYNDTTAANYTYRNNNVLPSGPRSFRPAMTFVISGP